MEEKIKLFRDIEKPMKPIKSTKHSWKKDGNGNVDEESWEDDFCSGVTCEICNDIVCVLCDPDYDELEDCCEHYVCPNCGQYVKVGEKCCSNCEQVIDWSDR